MWSKPYHSFLPSFHHVGKPEAQHGKGEQQAEMDDVGNQEGKNAAKDRRQRDVGHDGLDDEHVEAHRRRNLRDLKDAHHDDPEPDRVIAQRGEQREHDGHGHAKCRSIRFSARCLPLPDSR